MPGSNSPSSRLRDRLRAAQRELERQDTTSRRSLAELRSADTAVAPLAAGLLGALEARHASPSTGALPSRSAAHGHWRRA